MPSKCLHIAYRSISKGTSIIFLNNNVSEREGTKYEDDENKINRQKLLQGHKVHELENLI